MATVNIIYSGTPDAGNCHMQLRSQVKVLAGATLYDFTSDPLDGAQVKVVPSDDDVARLLLHLARVIVAKTNQNFANATAAATYLSGLSITIANA